MGLDMYLYAKEYVSGYDYKNDPKHGFMKIANPRLDIVANACNLNRTDLEPETPSAYVQFKVVQWRKANAIHNWFVNNVQGGEDNCAEYYVSRDELADLRSALDKALAIRDGNDDTPIEEVLPTGEGFFFGSTEYDKWYWAEIEYTYKEVDRLLTDPKFENFEFSYTSSW